MFRGNNPINLDTKGRMAIPARYRDALMAQCNGCLVATIDIQDKCLFIYPLPEWEKIEAQISALPTFNPSTRRLQRLLIGHARELELDGAGRVLIPPELRAFAEIDKKTMLVGQGRRFELWDLDNWNGQRDSWLEEAANELAIPDEMQSLSL
ncbi:MAG: division/cell wall cluster transcriptional repressor MraZ [Porticoccaceae bacterium]|nr:division/cell wall cluster transcriptional repressor MraZ [Porticoccaceae bacterium]MEA3298682.1 division/cell wall cluster transcriptional repressor MraZ [Pseudomonadota bacterium]HLS99309.1 division/cell wall cluster transcriptional repressor MraZ [Porticoccaceae bacterium]